MTPEGFVKGFYLERQFLIDSFFDPENRSEVAAIIKSLDLDEKQTERLRQVLSGALRDTLYSVLLGLEGEASIGGIQTTYKLLDEENNELSGGDIEAFAYEYFHNNKIQFDKGQADFIATLNYLTTEEGGREKSAFSGYRPHLKFDFSEMQTSGQQTFIDRKIVYPGDTVEAEIKIVAIKHFAGKLKEKMKFEFREGERTIGTGQITRIVNNSLKK